ncbi:MAG: tetratricopeptide repeat protein, partial [Deltaproteobacteria bacterium]|nr:tetratricopeptide repeat protein [Deltaproteobacteria bacterium]
MNTAMRSLGLLTIAFLFLAAPVAQAQEDLSPEESFRKANDLFVQGEYTEAVALYRAAIAGRQDFKEAWYNLGAAHGQLRQYDEEKAAYRKALELDPAYARAHYNLALALEDEGQAEEAVAEYRKTLEHE